MAKKATAETTRNPRARWMARIAQATLVALALGLGGAASASPESVGVDHVDEAHHGKNLLGVKVSSLTAFHRLTLSDMGDHLVFGAGPFYERELVPGVLEVEVAVLLFRGRGTTVMPVEVLLKKPFHASEHFTGYVGVGPTLDFVFEDGERRVLPAIVAAGGGYVWANSHIGVDVEVAVGHVFERPGLQEVVFATGPVLHF